MSRRRDQRLQNRRQLARRIAPSRRGEILPGGCAQEIQRLFGRSLKLRSVSAGGCNGCELELNALGNVNFDMGRFGIEFVASSRHADGIVLSAPRPEI